MKKGVGTMSLIHITVTARDLSLELGHSRSVVYNMQVLHWVVDWCCEFTNISV